MADERDDSRYLSVRRILILLVLGVLVPVVFMSGLGILALVLWSEVEDLVLGILTITLALASLGVTITILVMISRRSRLVRQQATFVANVTHELRTPLAAVRMYAQTLQLGHAKEPEEVKRCIAGVLREAAKLDRLVSRVLEWRLIVENERPYNCAPGSATDAVMDAVTSFRTVTEDDEVDLSIDVPPTRTILIDKDAVTGAVLNLLVNAHKYSADRKVISVSARDVDGGVEVTVRDNGIGLPKSEQRRVFEPFYRVDRRLSGRASGAGLGLAIVKDVVRGHGGSVRVDSEPGAGAAFTVFLPAPDGSAPAVPAGREG